mgnify:FL=1
MHRLQIGHEGTGSMPEMTEAEQERARIVAWLKDMEQNRRRSEDGVGLYWVGFVRRAIERNEHGGGE